MIIVLSGIIGSGKSTLAEKLTSVLNCRRLNTRDVITNIGGVVDRQSLQKHGNDLDATTDGTWVADALTRMDVSSTVVVDAVRTARQIEHIRLKFQCLHVHVNISTDESITRQRSRDGRVAEKDRTESNVASLQTIADIVLDGSSDIADSVARVMSRLVPTIDKCVDVIVGGQYGSEGKGHIVAHMASGYDLLVRVGGPNAGHTVLHPDDGHKVSFYHIPSGALHAPSSLLALGPGAVINTSVLEYEAKHLGGLQALAGRLFVDPNACVITESDISAENSLVSNIGSTGQGVGYATAGKIVDRGTRKLACDNEVLRPFIKPTHEVIAMTRINGGKIMMEGTQGTGLSLHHGYYPYVTSRDTCASSTIGEAGIPTSMVRKTIVVIRTFPIRVQSPVNGTSGPMGDEITWEHVSEQCGVEASVLSELERTTTTKRLRRVARFSFADLYRAARLNGPTDYALTFADYLSADNKNAKSFDELTNATKDFIVDVESIGNAPVSMINVGCFAGSVIDRRDWR